MADKNRIKEIRDRVEQKLKTVALGVLLTTGIASPISAQGNNAQQDYDSSNKIENIVENQVNKMSEIADELGFSENRSHVMFNSNQGCMIAENGIMLSNGNETVAATKRFSSSRLRFFTIDNNQVHEVTENHAISLAIGQQLKENAFEHFYSNGFSKEYSKELDHFIERTQVGKIYDDAKVLGLEAYKDNGQSAGWTRIGALEYEVKDNGQAHVVGPDGLMLTDANVGSSSAQYAAIKKDGTMKFYVKYGDSEVKETKNINVINKLAEVAKTHKHHPIAKEFMQTQQVNNLLLMQQSTNGY